MSGSASGGGSGDGRPARLAGPDRFATRGAPGSRQGEHGGYALPLSRIHANATRAGRGRTAQGLAEGRAATGRQAAVPSTQRQRQKKSPGGGPGLGWRSADTTDEESTADRARRSDPADGHKFRAAAKKIMNGAKDLLASAPSREQDLRRLWAKWLRCYTFAARRGRFDAFRVPQMPRILMC